jgi:peptidoglycan hydrolase-like protein with peptidoglycan-binding domain
MGTWPVVKDGESGENVRTVQYLLNQHGATLVTDGDFGALTKAAVEQFQGPHGLTSDGEVGDHTWPALIVEVTSGSTGAAVSAVQSQLKSRIGAVTVNGDFGPETNDFVRNFQRDLSLTVDGIVGAHTWNALVTGGLGTTGAEAAAQAVFAAWAEGDHGEAAKNANQQAVQQLFTRTWSASDGWAFDGCGGAAGSVYCRWTRPGGELVLRANNNTGTPFFFVVEATFQP